MSEAVVAKRYAEALFLIGEEKDVLDDFVEQLSVIANVFQDNEQLYTFFKHPRINNEKKMQFIQDAFKGLQIDLVNTVKLLVERRRAEITPYVIEHLNEMVNEAKGIAEVTVHSVRALSDAEKQNLADELATRFDKQAVNINNIVDAGIIGGLKIQYGNTILDGSISGKLSRIEQQIVSANKS